MRVTKKLSDTEYIVTTYTPIGNSVMPDYDEYYVFSYKVKYSGGEFRLASGVNGESSYEMEYKSGEIPGRKVDYDNDHYLVICE